MLVFWVKFQKSGLVSSRAAERDPGAGAPELGIFPGAGAGAQIKNQEPELNLKFRTGAGTWPFER